MGSTKPEPKSNGVAAILPLGSLAMVFLLLFSTVAVVTIADLMAEGDHDGYTLFTRAAIPVTCGHAMEVPDRMLKCISFLAGDHAAKMFSPGAATSSESQVSMSLDLLKRMLLPVGHLATLRSSLLARSLYWHALYF